MVTLKDVAVAAGVSITTASRVLNGVKFAERIGPARAAHVRQVAKKLGYVTNYQHRSLRMGRTEAIGVVLDIGTPGVLRPAQGQIGNPYFAGLIAGMESAALAAGYTLVLMGPKSEHQRALQRAIEAIRERRVDGVIVPGTRPRAGWEEMLRAHEDMAIGLIDSQYEMGLPGVRFDHRLGMHMIMDHLSGLGHRRVAWMGALDPSGVDLSREEAVLERGAAHGMTIDRWTGEWDNEGVVFALAPAELRAEWAAGVAGRFWRQVRERRVGERPTALVCYNDPMAVGAMRGLMKEGASVPRDVSITGFDSAESVWSVPGITSIDHQFAEMGRVVCQLVIARSQAILTAGDEKLGPAKTVWIKPELRVRESTGPAPKA